MAARTVQVQRWDPDGTIKLLGVILRGLPNLTGAACHGRHELFDELTGRLSPRVRELQRQRDSLAVEMCRGCPARPACSESLLRPTRGNEDPDRGIGAGRRPVSARSPVVILKVSVNR